MCCPTEQMMIESRLGKHGGIQKLEFNLMNRTLGVWHSLADAREIEREVAALGMRAEPLDAQDSAAPAQGDHHGHDHDHGSLSMRGKWLLALSGISAAGAEVLHFTEAAPEWVVAAVALLAILLCGPTTYKKGWIALRNLNLNINALMSIAVTGAVLIGQWPEAAMVMFLFTLAEMIEARSLDRARNAIRGLMDLAPERATVRQADGEWLEVDVKTVVIGALVRVRPGERIGLDGEIQRGSSAVNQAPITGESLPVEKSVGDPVFAGTINENGSFEYQVTAEAGNTTLARIIHAVEEAQNSRAPTQRFIDQFSRVYTPAVFFFALAVALVPPLLMGGTWTEWIYRALVLLVVACPCALVISTPVSIVSGLAAAARKGILVKGGVYLESGAKLSFITLDKTGTITHGKPEQTDYVAWVSDSGVDVPRVAASLAGRSDHPVSLAIAKRAALDESALLAVDEFEALPGRGVRGVVEGERHYLGNQRLIEELGLGSSALDAAMGDLERQGKTVVALATEARVVALFAVADTVKASSQAAIEALHRLGIKTMMLTGDNAHTAQAIASQVGIDEVRGNLLPADKLAAIGELQSRGHVVGMVGDGINDAPALASAQVGFAMAAAGTGTAIETADVALMDDDLRKLPAFIQLSRSTTAILRQNIGFALGIKAIFLVFTLLGWATMWMAVFADVGVSLLVVLNGLRLLKK
ncbi:heavy metal translocating P-type ATPase [Pseudomonas sp. GD03944]|uniref:heavy metal translocating P-type ATPase n=1 Tax=Pseudomonas sp. GD03944 TaxID=2975409 RepID=UPI002448C987|nr:heavy metal translocating P-type ATPase [Pseudomonas sp. GD03944]MDH1265326.1 heavy metal translocating P-type ATPase [Pseudomonas sp. GD03944]